jgi:hypothetical protein
MVDIASFSCFSFILLFPKARPKGPKELVWTSSKSSSKVTPVVTLSRAWTMMMVANKIFNAVDRR